MRPSGCKLSLPPADFATAEDAIRHAVNQPKLIELRAELAAAEAEGGSYTTDDVRWPSFRRFSGILAVAGVAGISLNLEVAGHHQTCGLNGTPLKGDCMTAVIVLLALSALIGFALGSASFSWLAIAASSTGIAVLSSAILQIQGFGDLPGIAIVVACLIVNQMAYLAGAF